MDDVFQVVKNGGALATTAARTDLLSVAEAGYRAIATPTVIRTQLTREGDVLTVGNRTYDLTQYEHVYLLGVGKCSLDAAPALAELLGERLTEGLFIDVRTGAAPKGIRILEGTHPYGSAQNAEHTQALLSLAERAGARDLVIILVSGGGSALLTRPVTHTPLDEVNLVRHLFKAGATIQELNTVRKHLSLARGGNLAAAAYPAEIVSLIFSDVPGDDLATIASGPTVLDVTTKADAIAVLERYQAFRVGFSNTHVLETPKETHYFERVHNELVLTNKTALEAMRVRAKELGYTALVRDTAFQGAARDIAHNVTAELHAARPGTMLLYGGESTVIISGPGKGGRNEELALAALPLLMDDELLSSLASDGKDNTEYAGGIADSTTLRLAEEHTLNPESYLYTNDSFTFFHTLQQGVETGYTGSNVADLLIGVKCKPEEAPQ